MYQVNPLIVLLPGHLGPRPLSPASCLVQANHRRAQRKPRTLRIHPSKLGPLGCITLMYPCPPLSHMSLAWRHKSDPKTWYCHPFGPQASASSFTPSFFTVRIAPLL